MLQIVPSLTRRGALAALLAFFLCGSGSASAQAPSDPLPSWNEGTAKKSITDFVARVTAQGSPDFVPVPERIATFDNDGTLWAEQPIYFQVQFAFDRAKELAPQHPEWKTRQPFKALLAGDHKGLAAQGEKALFEILRVTHTGMTTEAFAKDVTEWIATARHPRFKRPYTDLVYQPMLELLAYLRGNGFKTFIVSGGTIEFMRVWTDRVYGIPPEQVVGSSFETKFEFNDGNPRLMREPKIDFIDDKAGKPVGINKFIGRRPILAFGNSDGDQQMLEWTAAGNQGRSRPVFASAMGGRFMGLVHHTDAEREWAYDRNSNIGRLDKALDEAMRRGWTVASMKTDWKVIFPFEK
jgi:phosphoglycolate phosphatase-like HAD superfamily hydrolase